MPLVLRDGAASLTLSVSEVGASTGWCEAKIPLNLSDDELPRLAEGLRKLAQDGHGSFLWTNEGGELRIEIVMAKRGETHWSVRLQSPPDFLHELRLVFVGDQDDLLNQAVSL
ncbi:hypothetical protein EON82_17840 [bacterium]|nr:MAG: hypothetical protein EON82_17840 [bacterium]